MNYYVCHAWRPVRRDAIRGFTLIELMIALVLSLFLIGGVVLLFLSGRVAALDTERLSRAQEGLRFAATFMVQDMRMAGYKSGPGYAALSNGNSVLQIRYETPRDCTGLPTTPDLTAGEDEDLFPADGGIANNVYRLQGTQLICEGKRGNPVPLLDGVRSIGFQLLPVGTTQPVAVGVTLGVEGLQDYNFVVALRNPIVARISSD